VIAELVAHETDVAGAEERADEVERVREQLRADRVAEDVPGPSEEEEVIAREVPVEGGDADARERLHRGRGLIEVGEIDLDLSAEG